MNQSKNEIGDTFQIGIVSGPTHSLKFNCYKLNFFFSNMVLTNKHSLTRNFSPTLLAKFIKKMLLQSLSKNYRL